MPAMPGVPDRGHIAGGPRKLPLMHRQRSQPELMLKLRVSVKHAARHNAIDCGVSSCCVDAHFSGCAPGAKIGCTDPMRCCLACIRHQAGRKRSSERTDEVWPASSGFRKIWR